MNPRRSARGCGAYTQPLAIRLLRSGPPPSKVPFPPSSLGSYVWEVLRPTSEPATGALAFSFRLRHLRNFDFLSFGLFGPWESGFDFLALEVVVTLSEFP